MIRAVVFDMDGTLVDTEPGYRTAFLGAAAATGVAVRTAFYDGLVGLSSPDRAALLMAEYGTGFPLGAFMADYRARKAAGLAGGVPVRPGAVALLRWLRQAGIRAGVATSASRATADDLLGRGALRPWLAAVVTRDDVAAGKPHPAVYLTAAARLGVPAASCLAVEDSAPGLAAAHAAGMEAVLLTDAGLPGVHGTLRTRSRLHVASVGWQARRA